MGGGQSGFRSSQIRWTMAIEATTMSGACPATLSFEMNVAKGEAIVSSSILYSVSGGISQAGAVRRTISTATTAALVTGRVEGDEVGRGTWRTQDGSLLTCGEARPHTGREATRTKTLLTSSPTEGSPPAEAVHWMELSDGVRADTARRDPKTSLVVPTYAPWPCLGTLTPRVRFFLEVGPSRRWIWRVEPSSLNAPRVAS